MTSFIHTTKIAGREPGPDRIITTGRLGWNPLAQTFMSAESNLTVSAAVSRRRTPVETVLLLLTLLVSIVNAAGGRTNVLQGVVQRMPHM